MSFWVKKKFFGLHVLFDWVEKCPGEGVGERGAGRTEKCDEDKIFVGRARELEPLFLLGRELTTTVLYWVRCLWPRGKAGGGVLRGRVVAHPGNPHCVFS